MQNYKLGEYIRQRRLDLGLTQEQVCAGICESVTLSRVENGNRLPAENRINAILQRLGLPDDRYYAPGNTGRTGNRSTQERNCCL